MSTLAFVQSSEFDELLTAAEPIVVDFTATWCGPCRKVAPLLEQLAEAYQDRAKIVKVDVDHNKDLARRFEVKSIPAVLFFKGGELVDKIVGFASYEAFQEMLENHL